MPTRPPSENVARLVAEHHEVLYRYAFRLTGSVPDAEDLTQQTFLIAQAKLDQLRDADRSRNWLFAILRSCFLGALRQRRPVPATNIELNVNDIPANGAEEHDIDGERLQGALDELPEDFRLVLVMFYFEGCSYREIAKKLSLPPGTVMSRLSRAKGHLRRKLFDRAGSEVRPAGPHAGDVRTPEAGGARIRSRDDS